MKTKTGVGWSRGVMGVAAAALILAGVESRAAGLLIADGGLGGQLDIKEHDVEVTINNGIAVTRVTQVFVNLEDRQVEALYTFPVPRGASVANFSMWINGKEMIGEVVEKQRAREIYNSYKQVKRDPGLLEQKDYKTFEMRIFPIQPRAEQKVEISYYQELDYDHDMMTYVYPLATVTRTDIKSKTTGRFSINVDAKSTIPIREIESPSHASEFVLAKHAEHYAQASLEAAGGDLNRDVVIQVTATRPRTGIDIITAKEQNEDGYFALTLTSGEDLAGLNDGADYVFVLDVSGSMANDGKLPLSRNSIAAFIRELGPDDRFEVLTFNVELRTLFNQLQEVNEKNLETAERFLNLQHARGGTILNPAMSTAYRYGNPDRTLNVVIFSDGMTEQAERQVLLSQIQQRPSHARVFCIGVGNEVNRPLLEELAEESGGLAAFLSQEDNFERQAKAFRRKLMNPVASNLKINFAGVEVYDIEPQKLPNLFKGSPVRVYGRYKGGGELKADISGDIRGQTFSQVASLEMPAVDERNPEIERMWAWHKIDRLLKIADRTGSRQDVTAEVIRLGEAYSIATEYTSFLVLENDGEYQRWKINQQNALRIERDRRAQTEVRQGLEQLRSKAAAGLGPQEATSAAAPQVQQPGSPAPTQSAQAPRPRQSWDINTGGSGPVGPLFVMWSAYVAMRRRKAASD